MVTSNIVKIIKLIHLAAINLKLYPSNSKIVIDSLNAIFLLLSDYLKKNKSLLLAEVEGNLLVDNQSINIQEIEKNIITDFAFTLADKEIKSISFLNDLNLDELKIFIECLNKKGEQLRDEGGIEEILKKKNVSHIVLNKIIYVPITNDEEIEEKIKFLGTHKKDEVLAIIKMLEKDEEVVSPLDQISKEVILKQTSNNILDFEPEIVMNFFEHSLPSHISDLNIKNVILKNISSEKIEEIFNKIIEKYEELQKESKDSFEIKEKTLQIKDFFAKLIKASTAKKVPYQIYEKIFQKGLLEQIPDFVEKKEEVFLSKEKIEKIINEKNFDLLEDNLYQEISLIQNLCILGEYDLLKELLKKINSKFEEHAYEIRIRTAKLLKYFFDIFTKESKEEFLRLIENYFIIQIEIERNPEVYNELTHVLIIQANQYLIKGDFSNLTRLIDLFKKHHSLEQKLIAERYELSKKALDKMSQEMKDILMADLKSNVYKRQYESAQIILKFEDRMVEFLIDVIKESADARILQIAGNLLKNIGETGKKVLIRELNPMLSLEKLKNLIKILHLFKDDEIIIKRLEILLKHPEKNIRNEIVETIAKIPFAYKLLIDQLKDPDVFIQIKVVKLLGDLQSHDAIDELFHLMNTTSNIDLQKEICYTFEKIHDERIGIFLFSLVKKKKYFWGKDKLSPSVKVSAIWVLRNFLSPEIRLVLEKFKKSKDLSVQNIVKKVLEY